MIKKTVLVLTIIVIIAGVFQRSKYFSKKNDFIFQKKRVVDIDVNDKVNAVGCGINKTFLKYGIINIKGMEITPIIYDEARIISADLAAVKLNLKWAIVNKNTTIITPFKYDDVRGVTVKNNEKWAIINTVGKEITDFKFDGISTDYAKDLFVVWIKEKYGIVNNSGKVIVAVKYDAVAHCNKNTVRLTHEGKSEFFDLTEKKIKSVLYFDPECKIMIPFIYDEFDAVRYNPAFFSEGFLAVCKNDMWGFVNSYGQETTRIKYDYVHYFSEGLAGVEYDGKWGYIDQNGKEVIPPKYDMAGHFNNGIAQIQLDKKIGFINRKGLEITAIKYENEPYWYGELTECTNEGLSSVKLNDRWGFIDTAGKEIIGPKYNEVSEFNHGWARVKLDNKWGVIDTTGKEVICPKYHEISDFVNGLARVNLNNKWGYIDKKEIIVIPLKYNYTENFDYDQTIVGIQFNSYHFPVFESSRFPGLQDN